MQFIGHLLKDCGGNIFSILVDQIDFDAPASKRKPFLRRWFVAMASLLAHIAIEVADAAKLFGFLNATIFAQGYVQYFLFCDNVDGSFNLVGITGKHHSAVDGVVAKVKLTSGIVLLSETSHGGLL